MGMVEKIFVGGLMAVAYIMFSCVLIVEHRRINNYLKKRREEHKKIMDMYR